MRMRRKPWARPELEACDFYIQDTQSLRGKWADSFERKESPMHLELGCGKGGFISQLAPKNPDVNYIVVDIKSEVLVLAKRKIEAQYKEADLPIDNLKLMSQDIERIDTMLAPEDIIERVYINFCNPWPKLAHKKRRLTHTRQLEKYKTFLKSGAQIWFKTDDDELFEESIEYFEQSGFKIEYITRDLHQSGFEHNIITEHEIMFSEQGIKIKFLIASYN